MPAAAGDLTLEGRYSAPHQHLPAPGSLSRGGLWDLNVHTILFLTVSVGSGPYLGHHVESQAVDVIEIAHAEQGCEGATGQHPKRQVIPNRQAFPYYATEGTRKEASVRKHSTRPTALATSPSRMSCAIPWASRPRSPTNSRETGQGCFSVELTRSHGNFQAHFS